MKQMTLEDAQKIIADHAIGLFEGSYDEFVRAWQIVEYSMPSRRCLDCNSYKTYVNGGRFICTNCDI